MKNTQTFYTENGMVTLGSSGSNIVDLFYTVGAKRGQNIVPSFVNAVGDNLDLAVRTMLWARDIRGGAGERQLFRDVLGWLEANDFDVFKQVALIVPEIGRWDDLLVAKTDVGFAFVAAFILQSITAETSKMGFSTAAKWMPRKGEDAVRLRAAWSMTPKGYRKFLVRNTNVVENDMCAKNWNGIDFEKVPSVAMSRYTKAFARNAPESFASYKEALVKGDAKVNASAVYPYDVLGMLNKDEQMAEAMWAALPNYLGDSGILPMVDISGSMTMARVGNTNLTPLDVAVSLGAYIADKQSGAFGGLSLSFSDRPSIVDISRKRSLRDKRDAIVNYQNMGMSTNLQAAFTTILQTAVSNRVSQAEMPKFLLILSDMEFNSAVREGRSVTELDSAMSMIEKKYAEAGYVRPKVVFWNLASRNNNVPVTVDKYDTALVSGFSPSILKSILSANIKTFTPLNVVLETIMNERYNFRKNLPSDVVSSSVLASMATRIRGIKPKSETVAVRKTVTDDAKATFRSAVTNRNNVANRRYR